MASSSDYLTIISQCEDRIVALTVSNTTETEAQTKRIKELRDTIDWATKKLRGLGLDENGNGLAADEFFEEITQGYT